MKDELTKKLEDTDVEVNTVNLQGNHLMATLSSKAIRQIKQAFIDDGWAPAQEFELVDARSFVMSVVDNPRMTGQEWYDRFIKEVDGKVTVSTKVVEAAKKAAGIES